MSSGTRRAALRTAWHTAKVRTHRHRLLIMLGTIAGLWMLLILHLAGIAAVGTATAAVLTVIRGDHPFAQTVVILGGCILCMLLIVEWRGIMNAMTGDHALHRVERRKLYLPNRRQVITTILLTLTLLLFLWQVLASGAAGPLAQTLVPGSESVIIERTVAPARRPFGAQPGTVQLPSTLRRTISRYRYIEHRQFQIAADPINQTITGRFLTDDTGGTGVAALVGMKVNNDDYGAVNAAANGYFHFTGVTLTGGSIVTIYSQNSSNRAVTVTLGSGSSMTGVNLYKNHLSVRGNSGTALTNAHLAIADNGITADTSAIYAMGDSNTTLQVKPDKELYVWPAYSYTPGGRVKTHDLEVRGTMAMGTNGLTASGSFIANAGTFTTSTGVLLNSTGNSETLNPGSNSFQNLTINNGLAAYWSFDEGSGNKARDVSGNGNVATLTAMETATDWVTGVTSKLKFFNPNTLDFDGTDRVVSTYIPPSPAFTWSTWFTFDTIPGEFGFSTIMSVGNPSYILMDVDNTFNGSFWSNDGLGGGNMGVTGLSSGTWYHMVFVREGNSVTNGYRAYLNGVLKGVANTNSLAPTNPVYIGAREGVTQHWDGKIDDVRIYDRALSASEIAALYAGTKSTGSGVYTLGSTLDVNGNLTIISGTLNASSQTVTVAGNTDIHGDYVKDSGSTFTLDGTGNQTISGSTAFHNFTKTLSAAKTLFFDHTARQTASGTLTLQGAESQLMSLRTTRSGSATNLLLDGDTGLQSIDHLNVKDNDASGGYQLVCYINSEACVDAGNTTNWFLSNSTGSDITGKVFLNESGLNIGAGTTVAVSLNGGTAVKTDATDGGGQYVLSGVAMTGGTIVTLYIDNSSDDAVTVTLGSGSTMTGVHLYRNQLVVRSDSGSVALTNAHLAVADNNADSDISAIYSMSNQDLTLVAGKKLKVWSAKSYSPGGAIRTDSIHVDGTLNQGANILTLGQYTQSGGTFNGGSSLLDINGPFVLGGGTFRHGTSNVSISGNVRIDSSATFVASPNSSKLILDGDLTLSAPATKRLGNLQIGTSPDTTTLLTDITVGNLTVGTGDVLITDGYEISASGSVFLHGTLTASNGTDGATTLVFSGAWIKSSAAIFTPGSSSVILDGGNQTLSGSTTFYNLSKYVTSAATLTFAATTTQTITNHFALSGATSNLLSLRTNVSGVQAKINPSGTRSTSYLDVKDNNNTAFLIMSCAVGCVDGGNTINWFTGPQGYQGSTDYKLRPDVINSGGADWSKSTRYLLSDSIGEAVIGHGAATNYNLDSGYRQPSSANLLTISCSATADLGSVSGIGQRSGSGTCTIYTDAFNGYQLRWSVPTGSGGTNTGKLISQYNDTIGQFTPAVANVPETWSVTTSQAEWGARVRSISTDTAAEWGTDNTTDKWLNISTVGRTIISRATSTPPAGSVEIIQYRAEIGSSVLQPSGTYSATVVLTVIGL